METLEHKRNKRRDLNQLAARSASSREARKYSARLAEHARRYKKRRAARFAAAKEA